MAAFLTRLVTRTFAHYDKGAGVRYGYPPPPAGSCLRARLRLTATALTPICAPAQYCPAGDAAPPGATVERGALARASEKCPPPAFRVRFPFSVIDAAEAVPTRRPRSGLDRLARAARPAPAPSDLCATDAARSPKLDALHAGDSSPWRLADQRAGKRPFARLLASRLSPSPTSRRLCWGQIENRRGSGDGDALIEAVAACRPAPPRRTGANEERRLDAAAPMSPPPRCSTAQRRSASLPDFRGRTICAELAPRAAAAPARRLGGEELRRSSTCRTRRSWSDWTTAGPFPRRRRPRRAARPGGPQGGARRPSRLGNVRR